MPSTDESLDLWTHFHKITTTKGRWKQVGSERKRMPLVVYWFVVFARIFSCSYLLVALHNCPIAQLHMCQPSRQDIGPRLRASPSSMSDPPPIKNIRFSQQPPFPPFLDIDHPLPLHSHSQALSATCFCIFLLVEIALRSFFSVSKENTPTFNKIYIVWLQQLTK